MSSSDLGNLIEFRTLAGSLTDDEHSIFISQFCASLNRSEFVSILFNALYHSRNKMHICKVHEILTSIIHKRDDDDTEDDGVQKLNLTNLSSNTIQHSASYLSLSDLINFERSNRFIATCCRTSHASKHLNNNKWFRKYLLQNHDPSIHYPSFRDDDKCRHSIDIRYRFKNVDTIRLNLANIKHLNNAVINTRSRRQLWDRVYYPLDQPFYISAVSKQLLSTLFKSVIHLHLSINDYWETNVFDFDFAYDVKKISNDQWQPQQLLQCPHVHNACVVPSDLSELFRKLSQENIICEQKGCAHEQCWLCLKCHSLYCSRYGNQCMMSHYLETQKTHCIVMKIDKNIDKFWCYACDDFISYQAAQAPLVHKFYQIAQLAQNNGDYQAFVQQNTMTLEPVIKHKDDEDNDEKYDVGEIFENLKTLKITNSSTKSLLKFVNDFGSNLVNMNRIELNHITLRISRNQALNLFNPDGNSYDIYESIEDEEDDVVQQYISSFVRWILPNYPMNAVRKGYEYLSISDTEIRTNHAHHDQLLVNIFKDEQHVKISLKDLKGLAVHDFMGINFTESLLDYLVVTILNTLSAQLWSLHITSFPLIDSIKSKQISFHNLQELCISTEFQSEFQREVIEKTKTLKRLNVSFVHKFGDKHKTNKDFVAYLSSLSMVFSNNCKGLQHVNIRLFDTTNSVAVKEFVEYFVIMGLDQCGSTKIDSLRLQFQTASTYFYYDLEQVEKILITLDEHCTNCALIINNKMTDFCAEPNKKVTEKIRNQFKNILPQLFSNKIVVNPDNGYCDMIIYTKRNCKVPPYPCWHFACSHCNL